MIRRIVAIGLNTFVEIVRQPYYMLILFIGIVAISFSPAFTMFTLMESVKMVEDMGLATILLCCLFLSVYCAIYSIHHELDTHTVLTLMSKPVRHSDFIAGKFLGLCLAQMVAVYFLSIVLLLTVKSGVKDAAYTQLDLQCMWILGGAFLVTIMFSALLNFFADTFFLSTAVYVGIIVFLLALVAGALFNRDFALQVTDLGIKWELLKGTFTVYLVGLILSAFALMMACSFNAGATSFSAFLFFFVAMMSDYFFGRFAETSFVSRVLYALTPSLQIFWITDAIVDEIHIPMMYVIKSALYCGCFCTVFLSVAFYSLTRKDFS